MSEIPIQIYVAATWIKLHASKDGYLTPEVNIFHYLRNRLCEYDWQPATKQYTLTYSYFYYDKESSLITLPRYALDSLVEYIGNRAEITYQNIPPVQSRSISLKLKDKFQPREDQPAIIEFMTAPDNGFKPVSLRTGGGKTFCAECSIVQLGKATLVVLNSLIDQWYQSIRAHTNISADSIYIVKGFDSLKKLWDARNSKRKKYKPKIILFASRTLYLYAVERTSTYAELPSYDEFLQAFGIGIKIVDECHLGFHATAQIDMRSNIETNIYLSATYQRSNPQGKKIFNLVFPPNMKYGEQFLRRYTNVYMVQYSLMIRDTGFRTAKGYNHGLYENFLLKRGTTFNEFYALVIKTCLGKYFIEKRSEGQRCLVLCQTRKFCETIHDRITKDFEGLSCALYFSGDKKNDTDAIFSSDVIVSTIKSASTGLDIKGLKTAINTVSFASSPLAAQTMGRLRQLPDEETIFVDLWNADIAAHRFHKDSRINVYGNKALSVRNVGLWD